MPDAPLPVRPKTNLDAKYFGLSQYAAELIDGLLDRINLLEDANTRLRQEFDQFRDLVSDIPAKCDWIGCQRLSVGRINGGQVPLCEEHLRSTGSI